jgi:hypothetical protein
MRPPIWVGALDYPLIVRRCGTFDAASIVMLPANGPVTAGVLVHQVWRAHGHVHAVTDKSRLSKHAAELYDVRRQRNMIEGALRSRFGSALEYGSNNQAERSRSARAATFFAAADAASETVPAHVERASGRRTFISPKVTDRLVGASAAVADATNDVCARARPPLNGRRCRALDSVSFVNCRLTSRCC